MPDRVHQHLRTATRCRRILQARGGFQQPALGVGTREHKAIEEKHNRLAPYLVGHGPQPLQPSGAQLDPDDELPSHFDTSLLADIDGCIGQHEVLEDVCLLAELKATIRAKPRSWTTLTTTVGFALKELRAHPPPAEDGLAIRFCEIGPQLIDPSNWHFLGSLEKDKPYQEGGWERYLAELVMHPTAQWRQTHIPRHFGRERYFLHFFSGRRRPGDLQYYLDRHHFTGFTLYTVSIDIVVDANRGDLMKEETRQFWLRAIRQGHVVAMIGGPPCETWSQARTVSMDGNSHREGSRGPRAVRDECHPWGMDSLGLGELTQIIFGTTLLLFVLEAFCLTTIMGGAGLVEHPAEPTKDGCATIWRLAITSLLLQLPGVSRLRVIQGSLDQSPRSRLTWCMLDFPCWLISWQSTLSSRRSERPALEKMSLVGIVRPDLKNIHLLWTEPWHKPSRKALSDCRWTIQCNYLHLTWCHYFKRASVRRLVPILPLANPPEEVQALFWHPIICRFVQSFRNSTPANGRSKTLLHAERKKNAFRSFFFKTLKP